MRRPSGCGALIAALVILALIPLGFTFWHVEYQSERTVTFTVKSLDDQASAKGGHKYLVFTSGGQVYQNTDSWFHGKTDSSNVQNMFTVGDTYRCPVYGYRIFWYSSYPDILDGCKQIQGKM